MKSDIRKFAFKLTLLLLPLSLIPAVYAWLDPFKVVQHYTSYYTSDKHNYIYLNHDFTSVQNFLNNYPTHRYNSFIIGSSRSRNYRISEWQKYIGPQLCYHFDASDETIFGVHGKIKLLYNKKVKIKNALIIIDYSLLENTENVKQHIAMKHPAITGGLSFIPFQIESFLAFTDYHFLIGFFDYKFNGKVNRYYKVLDERLFTYDSVTNEEKWLNLDSTIAADKNGYYNILHKDVFYARDTTQVKVHTPVMHTKQKEMMEEMHKIFVEDSTNYKIIISPLYDQYKLDPKDIAIIQSIFGQNNVYDFSGVNSITNDKYNYYESSHYRPFVASYIMKCIYK